MLRNLIIVVSVFLAFGLINVFGQCPVRNKVINDLLGNDPKHRALFDKGIRFVLPQDTRFRVKFDSDISSEVYKVGDIVQFTVVENVYGVTMVNDKIEFGKDIKENEKIDTTNNDLKIKFENENLIIVIPKDTKGFGRVERSKKAVPFFLNGKAKISAILEYLVLADGTCVPLELARTADDVIKRFRGMKNDTPQNLIECKKVDDKLCVRGQRPTIKIGAPFITGISTTALVLANDSTATDVAAITAFQQTTTGGFSDLINGTNAVISKDFIYEVQNTKNVVGRAVGFLPPAPPKPTPPQTEINIFNN